MNAEHAQERRRVGEEALALAGEVGALELGALARHWLLYDLAELGELEEARRRHARARRTSRTSSSSRSTGTRRWPGAACGRRSTGRFEEAERIAGESVRLAERAGDPDARAHYTAQLVAVRREQGRLHELLPEIERLARPEPAASAWRSILPLAYLDGGDRAARSRRL